MWFFKFVIDRLKKTKTILNIIFFQYSASFAFIFMHLIDTFIQSAFPGNGTHDLWWMGTMTFELCSTELLNWIELKLN